MSVRNHVVLVANNPPAGSGKERFQSLGRQDALEKGMATHSSILDWRIPWTEEPGRLPSTESQSWTRLKQLSMKHFKRNLNKGLRQKIYKCCQSMKNIHPPKD